MKQQTAAQPPIKRRASAYTAGRSVPEPTTQEHILVEPKRARRKKTQQPPLADQLTRPITTTEPLHPSSRFHFLVYFGIGMLMVLFAIGVWMLFIVPKWNEFQNQWHYGDGRISRLDADVGHGGVSTFIAFDLNGQVMVIELPANSTANAKLYHVASLIGQGREDKIITLTVKDVNGDKKPDLIIHIEGESGDTILYNNGASFQSTVPQ